VDSLFLLFGVLFFFGVYLKSWISSHSICIVVGGTQLWRNQHSFLRDLTDSFEGITSLGGDLPLNERWWTRKISF
jgi:hypothetical protein